MIPDFPQLLKFERVVFFTGAGISNESGIPTYRGEKGVWKSYDFQRYACQSAFEQNPREVWEFHNLRRGLISSCLPNAAHLAIAKFGKIKTQTHVITQNIDGLHELAGSKNVTELHGSIWRVRCDLTGEKKYSREVPFDPLQENGSWWRPDIVWFGDHLNSKTIEESLRLAELCQVWVSIGTSATVFPAAELPLRAKQAGAILVEVNPEMTPLSEHYDFSMRGTAKEILPKLTSAT